MHKIENRKTIQIMNKTKRFWKKIKNTGKHLTKLTKKKREMV